VFFDPKGENTIEITGVRNRREAYGVRLIDWKLFSSMVILVPSKLYDHIPTKRQSGNFGSELNDGFLQYIVEIGIDHPSTRQRFVHIAEILAVREELVRSAGDIATFAP
jgi:hypothetical protein